MPNQDPTQNPQSAPSGQSSDPTINQIPPVEPSVTPVVQQSDTLTGMPVHTDLPPLPPDFQSVAPEDSTVPPTTSDQPTEDSGSAAPSDLPPMVATPKKKFGGAKIIATILGIFLLVGGVAAGLFLTQQQQLFQQKASGCGSVGQSCRYNGDCCSLTCDTSAGKCANPPTPKKYSCNNTSGNCSESVNGSYDSSTSCESACKVVQRHFKCNTTTGSCSENDSGNFTDSGTCESACEKVPPATESNCTDKIDNDSDGFVDCKDDDCKLTAACVPAKEICTDKIDNDSDGLVDCDDSDCSSTTACTGICNNTDKLCANGYNCTGGGCVPGGGEGGGAPVSCTRPCADADKVCEPPDRRECKTTGVNGTKWCLIDHGCGKEPTPKPPQPTPPTPGPTAVCQSVKAYSSDWQVLSPTNLSALTAGTAINFCVTGSASTGSFDKGKFTINGVAQAETTVRRPTPETTTNDFCQSYTIPVGVTTFNVTAQIHHSTQGWK